MNIPESTVVELHREALTLAVRRGYLLALADVLKAIDRTEIADPESAEGRDYLVAEEAALFRGRKDIRKELTLTIKELAK